MGKLTQYGAYLVTLEPGERSSNRHWHEQEDEFLFVVSGELTIYENDGAHVLYPKDSACWPAGKPNAHFVKNESDRQHPLEALELADWPIKLLKLGDVSPHEIHSSLGYA